MRRILAGLSLVFLLVGCQAAQVATTPVDITVASKSAFAARAAYAGLLSAAVAYSGRPRCDRPAAPVLCSDGAVVSQLRQASAAADAATSAAESAVRSLGSNPTAIAAAVTAAEKSIEALRAITSTYAASK